MKITYNPSSANSIILAGLQSLLYAGEVDLVAEADAEETDCIDFFNKTAKKIVVVPGTGAMEPAIQTANRVFKAAGPPFILNFASSKLKNWRKSESDLIKKGLVFKYGSMDEDRNLLIGLRQMIVSDVVDPELERLGEISSGVGAAKAEKEIGAAKKKVTSLEDANTQLRADIAELKRSLKDYEKVKKDKELIESKMNKMVKEFTSIKNKLKKAEEELAKKK